MTARQILALAILATVAAPGCSLFRQPNPDDSCVRDQDCFRGIGETCLRERDGGPGRCGIAVDAAPLPDAPQRPVDAALPDTGAIIDGAAVDGAAVDGAGVDA